MNNDFTFQSKRDANVLEMYEWDNTWWEQAPGTDRKRVLYIGDSISCGIRRIATEVSGRELLFDSFGTSKALDNPYFQESVRLFALQEKHRELVLFNNGLHGWHLTAEAFENDYAKMLSFLKNEFPQTPIVIVLSTSVLDEKDDKKVVEYNSIAKELASKSHIPVIDLYAETKGKTQWYCPDGVHFCAEGYHCLAEKIVAAVRKVLKTD